MEIKSIILFFGIFLIFVQTLSGRENISKNDTIDRIINLDTIIVEQGKNAKITGISSGKIKLHVEGIKQIPSIMGTLDVLRVLELTPGVQTSGEGKSNIYVRGGDPGQTLLLFSDIPVYTPGHALNIFPLFNADHLSTIELIKGGVNASYGNFVSGAIISKSKEEAPLKTSIKGNIGLLASQTTLDLRINDRFGAYVSGRKTYLNLFLNPIINGVMNRTFKTPVENISYDFYDTNATVIGKLSNKNKLLIHFFTGQDGLNIIENEVGGVLDWGNYAFAGKLETCFNENSTMEQQITYSRFENRLNISLADIRNVETFSNIANAGYDNKLRHKIGEFYFESGIQYKYYRLFPKELKENHEFDFIFPDISYGKNTAHYLSLFTATKLYFVQRLTLEPGIRYNFFYSKIDKSDKSKDFHSVDFRLLSRFQLNENQCFRATLSHNNQYVSKLFPSSIGIPTDFWVAASSEIRPLSSNEFSLGYYQSLRHGMFELSSDVYFRTLKNAAEYNQNFIENDDRIFTEKILFGKGRAYGIEFMLKKNYGKFSGWLSYSLGRSERKFNEINQGTYFPATHDRTHDFSFTGTYSLSEKWNFSLTQVYATGNAYTAPTSWYFIENTPVKEYGRYNAQRLPDYNRTDIGINYWFKKDNGINLSIYNLFVIHNPLYVNLRMHSVEDEKDKIVISMKKNTLFTIMPSISWIFKF